MKSQQNAEPTPGTLLSSIDWTEERAAAEVASLDDSARKILLDALRRADWVDSDSVILSEVRRIVSAGVGFWEYGPAGERLSAAVEAERAGMRAYAYPDDDPRGRYVTLDEI